MYIILINLMVCSQDLPIYFILFMDVTVLLITFNLVMSFMMFFYFFKEDSCTWPYLFGGANFFGAVCKWIWNII